MAVQGVEKYFFYIKEKVASDWKDLAFFLGFSGTDVGNIGGRNYDDKSSCMDLLQEWATANGTDATIEVLMEALSNAGLRSVADGLKAELRPYFNIIAENMPADWPQLATNLGIPFAQIQAIQQQNRDNCWMCCQQILHMWCYNNGQEATVEVLMQAVRDTGHQDVAEMLEIKQLE
uniref:Death domain-containing protein n=1 Tax=Branchiostoma floridae TaxID=7739 RepID=C3YMN5_BRAFL|eukprot:XP_002602364.1 hypothetical protein BRAFLDRAFT_98008 [Branchiostoma floridae]